MDDPTLRDAFLRYCRSHPQAAAVQAYSASCEVTLSREQLLRRALSAARCLQSVGMAKGDRVMVALQNDLAFPQWFWGAQLLGAVPIPVEPALSRRRRAAQLQWIRKLVCIARPKALVASSGSLIQEDDLAGVRWLPATETRDLDTSLESLRDETLPNVRLQPGDTTLIQFSSGSTADPKGCVLSHRAVCSNARAWICQFDYRPGESTLNWMPMFHDFGLMLGVIAPVVAGMKSILLRAHAFVADPCSWLTRLGAAGCVHTAAPASALPLVHARLSGRPRRTFALQSVRSLVCAAEPINPGNATRFIGLMQHHGFDPEAFYAGYGMSETTVMASARQKLQVDPVYCPGGLGIGAAMCRAGPSQETAAFVSLGRASPGASFRIVDETGTTLPERRLGHLLLSSDSLMDGYLGEAREGSGLREDGWLWTGDLGYLVEGEFHFVARSKDLIVVAGTKIIPSDIEQAVAAALEIVDHRVASFGYSTNAATEAIVVVVETRARDTEEIKKRARQACYEQTGFQPARVLTCPIGAIPRTSSGKTRRQALRRCLYDQLPGLPADASHGPMP
jgi:fatty-acyl-CoA synthase